MEFDPKEGKLRCLSCDYLEAVLARNEEETNAAEQDFIYAERIGNQDWGVVKKTVRCEKCGIEIYYGINYPRKGVTVTEWKRKKDIR